MYVRVISLLLLGVGTTKSIKLEQETTEQRNRVREILSRLRYAEEKKHPSDPDDIDSYQFLILNQHGDFELQEDDASTDLFEGDIMLSLPQAEQILEEVQQTNEYAVESTRRKRQAVASHKMFWSDAYVPFEFGDERARPLTMKAVANIEAATCVKFKPRNSEPDYVVIYALTGCFSAVGRVGGMQPVSMGLDCSVGAATHELVHTLGLWHEQARSDRDRFVNVVYANVQANRKDNFVKRSKNDTNNFSERYDYGSIMHYNSQSFGAWAKTTIKTVDPMYQQTIGQRAGLSFKDAKVINKMYCEDVCKRKLPCNELGYTDPLKCNVCRCPDGLAGRLCEKVDRSDFPECGSNELSASTNPASISLARVTRKGRCVYRIKANRGKRVKLEMQAMDFPCDNLCSSYVEVKRLNDKSTTGFRLCCINEAKKYNIVSQGNDMVVIVYFNGGGAHTTRMLFHQVNNKHY